MSKFPFQRQFYTDEQIYKRFDELKNYDYYDELVIDRKYTIKNLMLNEHQMEYIGHPVLLVRKGEYKLSISDIFQEECRIQCKKWFNTKSPLEIWNTEQKKISEMAMELYGNNDPKSMREALWKIAKECEPFKPENIIVMIKMFNAKSVLDFSSGWGDRLIGAMSQSGVKYCGVDPNKCLFPNYKKMIKFFGGKAKMINSIIEDAVLGVGKYDLIMTSPPYFDLESYSNNKSQSNKKWKGNEKAWFDGFLCVAIAKCWKRLKNGGHMVLNINQKNKNEHYIKWMLDYMYTIVGDSHYFGVISYTDEKISNPQPMFIWEKGQMVPEILYNPPFIVDEYTIEKKTFYVIDEGKLVTGSKQRAIVPYIVIHPEIDEFVYAGPVQGAGAISLAYGAELMRKKSTIIVEKMRPQHPHTAYIKMFRGATIVEVEVPNEKKKKGYIEFLENEAEKYMKGKSRIMRLKFGLDDPEYTNLFYEQLMKARKRISDPKRMWLVAGSATLLNVLYKVFPKTFFCVVQVGRTIWPDQIDKNRTKLYISDQLFHEVAKEQPPFKTVKTYDAKLWKFFLIDGKNGDYIFNVSRTR